MTIACMFKGYVIQIAHSAIRVSDKDHRRLSLYTCRCTTRLAAQLFCAVDVMNRILWNICIWFAKSHLTYISTIKTTDSLSCIWGQFFFLRFSSQVFINKYRPNIASLITGSTWINARAWPSMCWQFKHGYFKHILFAIQNSNRTIHIIAKFKHINCTHLIMPLEKNLPRRLTDIDDITWSRMVSWF